MSLNVSCDPAGTIVHGMLRVPAASVLVVGSLCAALYGNPTTFLKEKVAIQSCQRVGPDNGMTKVVINGVTCCMKRDAVCSGDK